MASAAEYGTIMFNGAILLTESRELMRALCKEWMKKVWFKVVHVQDNLTNKHKFHLPCLHPFAYHTVAEFLT